MSDQANSKEAAKYQKLNRKLQRRITKREDIHLLAEILSWEIQKLERRLKNLPVPSSINSEANSTEADDASLSPRVHFDDGSTESHELLGHSDTESENPPRKDYTEPIPIINGSDSKASESPLAKLVNSTHYPPPGIDLERLVSWQIERHCQWAGKYGAWESKEEIHTALDIRSASELKLGKPYGKRNIELNPTGREYYRHGFKWGRPAAALLEAFHECNWHSCKDPAR
ncbi:hypothetical protein N7478_006170 [Penicillium angulare]|uniref:uncharacterized protein n=1 Tax=Penicillium angulare TaxID=116970 RepID=UPI0025413377|nr:uncharacterized protein N7478_006170 [Penicillium angulare]KAJ5280798.1 hypothetical protein N7478_006170 [Penicillium angulare]